MQSTLDQHSAGGYVPGSYYSIYGGITADDYVKKYRLATPVEDGFLNTGAKYANNCVIFYNASNRPVFAELRDRKPINPAKSHERFNYRLIDGLDLVPGEGSHIPVQASHYTVCFSRWEETETGKRVELTKEGLTYNSLANKAFSITHGRKAGTTTLTSCGVLQDNFSEFENLLGYDIHASITRESTAYPLSDEQVARLKSERTSDPGPKVIAEARIPPGGKWLIRIPLAHFIVYVILPFTEDDGALSTIAPPLGNYVQAACAECNIGDVVFIAKDAGSDGVTLVVNAYRDIKAVSSQLVRDDVRTR